jgi:hypothetical protein
MSTPPTSLEKQSLEAHVDLCALRYLQLDTRLTGLEKKVESVHEDIVSGQKSLTRVIIGTAGTVIAGVISVAITVLMKMG